MRTLAIRICILSVAIAGSTGCRTTQGGESDVSADYRDVSIGDYSDASLHIDDCGGKTFTSFMKEKIAPMIVRESYNRQRTKLAGVRAGHGVEVRLTNDVTTYHVAFPRGRRGGRSFGAVGDNPRRMDYVADASYSFYFDSLERAYWEDPDQLRNFFEAIFGVLLKCDARKFDTLNYKYKRVAVDFIAVYIAEQYRNLSRSNFAYLRDGDWDNSHLQTTMLAAFHSGQTREEKGMFFEGRFVRDTFDTWDCVYRESDRQGNRARPMRLRDYTQANRTCERSGVGQTRRDWSKLTWAISDYMKDRPETRQWQEAMGTRYHNVFLTAANFMTDNDNDGDLGDRADPIIKTTVDYFMAVQNEALDITRELFRQNGNNAGVTYAALQEEDLPREDAEDGPDANPSMPATVGGWQ